MMAGAADDWVILVCPPGAQDGRSARRGFTFMGPAAAPMCDIANKGDLLVLVEGDPRLLNRYDVILLNPGRHAVPKQALARHFAQWLVSPEGTWVSTGGRNMLSRCLWPLSHA
jgi:hypothetical protein